MQIEIAEFGKMSQSGSSLLKLIQNNDLPILDLLVREAVQNCLDAGISIKNHDSVYVDIGLKSIDTSNFIKHLDGIRERLNKEYTHFPQKALYIVDTNTAGLTGSLDFKNEPTGNIFKLVYGISMAQDAPGAGGSWGLGKTVYFRVGIGLVVYYSRIKNDFGQYEHRLAVTLVENEKLENTILPKGRGTVPSGIAWWGQPVGMDSKETIPLTDERQIQEILQSLNIELFEDEQTGTKIIIPFINEEKLLVKHKINPDENKPWESSVIEYIKIAMQRWYIPRLANKKYPYGKYLDGHVNGQRLEKDDLLPTFMELQLMYNAASTDGRSKRYLVNDIQIRHYFEHNKLNNAGRVAYKKFTKKEIEMLPPINSPNPFTCIDKANPMGEQNAPIIAYTRKPGMIVNYETNGEWCKGIGATEEHEYLLAIFVPNSETKLLNPDSEVQDLEGYLRKSEMADHTSWTDIIVDGKPVDIVQKIRSQVRRKMKASFEIKEDIKEKQIKNVLARNVGKLLLPPTGFGKRAASRNLAGTGKTKVGLTSQSRNGFNVISKKYMDNDSIEIEFELKLSQKVGSFRVELFVTSEGGRISAEEWETSVGTPFPVQITRISLPNTVGFFGKSKAYKTENKIIYAIQIEKKDVSLECKGVLGFDCLDSHVQVEVVMKAEGREDNS